MPKYGLINAFWLKGIMLVLMLLDHLYYFIFPKELLFAHYLARAVAPVFAYFVSEGMVYTRDRLRYIRRLFTAGIIMAGGNFIVYTITKINVPNNIFLSLALGASLVYLKDALKLDKKAGYYYILIVVCIVASFYCEGGYLVPIMVLIFYYLRHKKALMYITYVVLTGLPFFITYLRTGDLQPQFYMITAVLVLLLYNGRRGYDNVFAKYLFYVFYPVHIWLIVFIKFFLKTT